MCPAVAHPSMVDYPTLPTAERIARLELPADPAPVVLDTDAYNEIDDQFAAAHLLRSDHDVEAVYAAPFHNDRSDGPGDGMEKSYEELERLLPLLGRSDDLARRGAPRYMESPDDPVESPATADLVERARADRDGPLYVVAIGAATNVASAIASAPDIVGDVVVVWLGGHPVDWHTAEEFNLRQDRYAARVLFDSGVPLIHVPCLNVAEHVKTTVPELERHLRGRGEAADFLFERFAEYDDTDGGVWSKELWDLAATAALAVPGAVESCLDHSPVLTSELTWSRDPNRHLIRRTTRVDRDAVLRDLFERL